MRIRLLGPVAVGTDAVQAALGGPKPKALLVALARQGGHVVGIDRLVDLLWGETPPASGTALVHTYVSQLRRALAKVGLPDALRTSSPGYRLVAEPGDCDVDVFTAEHTAAREAERSGDHAAAHAAYGRALALWRGPALDGVDADFALAWAQELAEHRLAARDGLARTALALGRPLSAADELRGLVAEHPLREESRALLMRALAESGRQADALEVYRDGRRHLLDELGIEPGRGLRELHTAILDGSLTTPAADVPRPAAAAAAVTATATAAPARPLTRTLPPDINDFTGRADELAAILALGATGPDRPAAPVVVVSGAGGTGKSALAVHAAHLLAEQYPDGQLFTDLRGHGAPPSASTVLARFLGALGVPVEDLPPGLDDRIALYRRHLTGRRLVIVLDNARTEQQVRPLLPTEPGCLVLVTSRARLAGLGSAVDLEVFDAGSAVEMLGRIIGSDRVASAPDAARRIATLCAGVPLAIRAAGAKLLARPHWPLKSLATRLSDERRRLDELTVGDLAIRSCLGLNYAELDERAKHAFHLLCLLDLPDFGWWVAAPLLGVDTATAEDLVENLVDLRLLDVAGIDPIGRVRYRFHDLVQLFGAELAAQHEPPGAATDAVAACLAAWADLAETGVKGLPRVTLSPRLPAAPAGAPSTDPELVAEVEADPAGWLDAETAAAVRAVHRAHELRVDAVTTLRVAVLLSSAFAARNEFEAWQRTLRVALALAEESGDPRAGAVVLAGLGQLHAELDEYDEALAHFERALERADAAGDDAVRAVCLAGTGTAHRERGNPELAATALTAAAELGAALADDAVVAAAEYGLGALRRDLGDLAGAADRFDRAVRRYAAAGDRRGEALALRGVALCHRARGEHRVSAELCERAAVALDEVGDALGAAYARQAWAKAALRLPGSPTAELAACLDACLAVCERGNDRFGVALVTRTTGELHLSRGDLATAREHLRAALAGWTELGLDTWRARTLRDLAAADPEHQDEHWALARELLSGTGAREERELAETTPVGWRAAVVR
ncbi:AfsR/SARP family transcriptional regulator [Actinosynnema mirum]|uniref:Transcriptional regulator, SARP family n=1 Tax=Actinosynnema mirum (strain ATCC 29888 / DSM 43827 / JCM 3225 / NBRC 14064 / NCIMB 13271 / NRRL B-12336 / IMRU 3971 / 101) TaxID=446462 RepID=C6W971_ACTMD|nr:BTAD domain-containing putative transcriptional regulator [Actinosynnema mirum]ACU39143.1 transcriptional regulator, SARP family [Actinosynnema mirum DSM 43827]